MLYNAFVLQMTDLYDVDRPSETYIFLSSESLLICPADLKNLVREFDWVGGRGGEGEGVGRRFKFWNHAWKSWSHIESDNMSCSLMWTLAAATG
jgi:hypothetical protein